MKYDWLFVNNYKALALLNNFPLHRSCTAERNKSGRFEDFEVDMDIAAYYTTGKTMDAFFGISKEKSSEG